MNRILRLATPLALAGLLVGAVATPAHAQTLLDHGHVDVFDIDYLAASDSLDVNVRAYADTGAPGLYDPANAVIEVAQSFPVPASWDICATGTAWVLPQQQMSGLVWAGWNTDDVQAGNVPGDQVTVNLVSVDNLDGGSDVDEFCIYTASGGAVTGVFLDTEGGPNSFPVPAADHAHANWTFDDPGTYQVTINVTGASTTASGNHTFSFEVG